MKQWVAAASAAGLLACFATKKKQEAARRAGSHVPYGVYEAVVKRPLDIALSGIGLLVFSPALAATAFLVRVNLGAPILFKQKRPGKDEKVFEILKFRTMTDRKDRNGEPLADEERLTRFGKKLRSASVDELPELINIFRGDMSIVGPRPLLVEYLPRYSPKQRRRHDVRPGLTGLAQVRGRNQTSWEERFENDIKYVDKITYMGDLKIMLDTVRVVLKREGINHKGAATMTEFKG